MSGCLQGRGADDPGVRVQADNVKRTFDYEPFIREFVTALEHEGLLDGILAGAAGDGSETRPSADAAGGKGTAKRARKR